MNKKGHSRNTVVIAGSTGFFGQSLIPVLSKSHDIIGLARNPEKFHGSRSIRYVSCDLYSLLDAENSLEGADTGIYLVHSMMPGSRLSQGSFSDRDLILADNFARAAKKANLKHIIYIGGIIPEEGELSPHLQSRLEVENALASTGIPVTALRCGLIIGAGGSSFRILIRLCRRLPAMICPAWTMSKTQPVALEDAITAAVLAIENKKFQGKTYNVGGPDIMSYRDMISRTAKIMGHRRLLLNVPFFSPALSKLWVSIFSETAMQLVSPLIDSLLHPMVAGKNNILERAALKTKPFDIATKQSVEQETVFEGDSFSGCTYRLIQRILSGLFPYEVIQKNYKKDTVRSIQRMPLPASMTAEEAVQDYLAWLQRKLKPFIRIELYSEERSCRFYFRLLKKPLLDLQFSKERSTEDRQLFYIRDGILLKTNCDRGRFEFRQVFKKTDNDTSPDPCLIAAIHDFEPAIPWFLYNISQALVHLWLMKSFSRHLEALKERQPEDQSNGRTTADEKSSE